MLFALQAMYENERTVRQLKLCSPQRRVPAHPGEVWANVVRASTCFGPLPPVSRLHRWIPFRIPRGVSHTLVEGLDGDLVGILPGHQHLEDLEVVLPDLQPADVCWERK